MHQKAIYHTQSKFHEYAHVTSLQSMIIDSVSMMFIRDKKKGGGGGGKVRKVYLKIQNAQKKKSKAVKKN